ncbi:hypothetical protein MMC13_004929 [Lambiella insularis]|nr:hypothetical protein [Lambiella insularis]
MPDLFETQTLESWITYFNDGSFQKCFPAVTVVNVVWGNDVATQWTHGYDWDMPTFEILRKAIEGNVRAKTVRVFVRPFYREYAPPTMAADMEKAMTLGTWRPAPNRS